MKTIVITGSTRGIGSGLAQEFLKRGHQVVISGHTLESTNQALALLAEKYPAQNLVGQACAVEDYEQVQKLWDKALASFGKVDIWINNAGMGYPRQPLWQVPVETLEAVVRTNLSGAMYGSKVALNGMLKQGYGQLYNMEGLGSLGPVIKGTILYGATKAGLSYLTKGLVKEARNTPVQIAFISPGIVITEMLEGSGEDGKKFFRLMADRVETVTPWLVEQILANRRQGAHINWLPWYKLFWRLVKAPFTRRNPFSPCPA